MRGPTLDEAELAGIVVQSCLYGLFLATFMACQHVLLYRKQRNSISFKGARSRVNVPMLVASIILFVLCTTHWILDISRLFSAFISTPDGALAYYGNIALPVDVAKTTIYCFETAFADTLLIYRLSIVWKSNGWVCVLPICATLSFVGITVKIIIDYATFKPSPTALFQTQLGQLVESAFSLTLLTNLYCTGLISAKIWHSTRKVRAFRVQSNLMAVVGILIESAAIYTIVVSMTLILYSVKSNIQTITLDANAPVIGLTFCLIIVRIGLGASHEANNDTVIDTVRSVSFNTRSSTRGRQNDSNAAVGHVSTIDVPMKTMAVNITEEVESDAGLYNKGFSEASSAV